MSCLTGQHGRILEAFTMGYSFTCRHPVHFAGLYYLLDSETIPVRYLTAEQITHRRQTDMRVGEYIGFGCRRRLQGYRPSMIHKDKWSDHSSKPKGEYALYLKTRSD